MAIGFVVLTSLNRLITEKNHTHIVLIIRVVTDDAPWSLEEIMVRDVSSAVHFEERDVVLPGQSDEIVLLVDRENVAGNVCGVNALLLHSLLSLVKEFLALVFGSLL